MSQTVEEAVTKISDRLDKTMRGTLLGLANRTIDATPVDTGRLRSNWQVSTTNFPNGELEVSSEAVPKAAAMNTVTKMQVGDTFFFSNNMSYAEQQEERKGMLAKAVNALLVEIG